MNKPIYNLSSLTPDSTLAEFLRSVYETAVEYAVYIPEVGDAIILSKGQLISIVGRNCADAMIMRLPQLIERNIFNPLDPNGIDYPEENLALYVKNTGAFLNTLELALYPDEPQYPEWWNAPVPFAMASRGILRLNETAIKMFGVGLEQLNAQELPDRDEFIVKLEGLNGTRFIAFKKLKPGIFTIDDYTEDLTDAQDITWWAAVGRTWVKEIESKGGTWQRLDTPPEGKKTFRACEWNGQLQGYINIELPSRKKPAPKKVEPVKISPPENIPEPVVPETVQDIIPPEPQIQITDDVIDRIGPQAMALLAAGQTRDNDFLM